MIFDFKKVYKKFYTAKSKPEILNVPKANYIAVKGKGNPSKKGGTYQQSVKIIYAIAYTLKLSYKLNYKIEGYYDYVVPPLEVFLWQKNYLDIDYSNKDSFNWITAIRLPDFVTLKDFEWAVETASKKKNIDCSIAEFLCIEEGLCGQIMHYGSLIYESETIYTLNSYIGRYGYENDFSCDRQHHEIYLSDAKKVAPSNRKTIIRFPIKKSDSTQ